MTIETNREPLSVRVLPVVAPSRRIDVDPWGHAPDVARDTHTQTDGAYQTLAQIQEATANERRKDLLDPHAKAIDSLGAAASGRRAGVYDQERDLMTISDKKPRYRIGSPEL